MGMVDAVGEYLGLHLGARAMAMAKKTLANKWIDSMENGVCAIRTEHGLGWMTISSSAL